MNNIEELNYTLKELNKRKLIYNLCILASLIIIIAGIICKIPNLNGGIVIIGTIMTITFGVINSKNNNKIYQVKKQIYEIKTITKAIEDSK